MVSEAIRHPEILSQEVQRHAQTGDGNLGERMTRLHTEIVREGSYFPSLLEPRRRSERALLAVIQQAYVEGVS